MHSTPKPPTRAQAKAAGRQNVQRSKDATIASLRAENARLLRDNLLLAEAVSTFSKRIDAYEGKQPLNDVVEESK